MKTIFERARAYIARMPVSVSGQGGHTAAFNAAVILIRGFGLTDTDALALLTEWNAGCLPPWSEAVLRAKLRSASSSSTKPLGYLLNDQESTKPGMVPDFETDDERMARRRAEWPRTSRLTHAEIETIADLRRLPVDAVDLCSRYGFVGSATVDGHHCFVIGEGLFVQARRFDGKPFTLRDDSTPNTKNLPGSTGAFIGQKWLGDTPPILLVEGAIALLEAASAIILANRFDWTVLAATSAYSRFARDPELLARLKGRRVRIIPDADNAGMDGAATWLTDMEGVGATVDAFALPEGCKDLGPIVAAPEAYLETLKALLQ